MQSTLDLFVVQSYKKLKKIFEYLIERRMFYAYEKMKTRKDGYVSSSEDHDHDMHGNENWNEVCGCKYVF